MKFRYLFTLLLISISIFALSSCGHEHSFQDWTVIKASSCTQDGLREGTCECGTKETQVISAAHAWEKVDCQAEQRCTKCDATRTNPIKHTLSYSSNTCKNCGMPRITINIPELPMIVNRHDVNGAIKESFKITEISYEIISSTSATISWGGEKLEAVSGLTSSETYIAYRIVDSEGYVIASGFDGTTSIGVGDKVRNQTFTVSNLSEWGEYTLEIKSVIDKTETNEN